MCLKLQLKWLPFCSCKAFRAPGSSRLLGSIQTLPFPHRWSVPHRWSPRPGERIGAMYTLWNKAWNGREGGARHRVHEVCTPRWIIWKSTEQLVVFSVFWGVAATMKISTGVEVVVVRDRPSWTSCDKICILQCLGWGLDYSVFSFVTLRPVSAGKKIGTPRYLSGDQKFP